MYKSVFVSKMFWCSVLFLSVFTFTHASIRSYILPCSRTKGFEKCAVEHAIYAIPHLIKGDKKLKIPSMTPLKIPKVDMKGTNNFNLKLENLEINGLENTLPLKISANFNTRKVHFTSKVEHINIVSDYNMNGKLLMFPITGNGLANMTLHGGIYHYMFEYALQNRNGKNYAKIIKSTYDYKLEKVTYNFENLFQGDKLLGSELNKFLNENWRQVDEDLRKPVQETLLLFQNDIVQKIANEIPYDDLFLD